MTQMRFIGDVHGKMDEYVILTDGCKSSIQVGDFGAGFTSLPVLSRNHMFIRGNHDSPEVCKTHPNWIGDGSAFCGMFFMGGALSIDRKFRVEGLSWWRDEELSIETLDHMVNSYEAYAPEVMVTHDCPESVSTQFHNGWKINDPSRTRHALQTMLEIHQPKIWIFGHWHESLDVELYGTRFICLNELEYKDLDI